MVVKWSTCTTNSPFFGTSSGDLTSTRTGENSYNCVAGVSAGNYKDKSSITINKIHFSGNS